MLFIFPPFLPLAHISPMPDDSSCLFSPPLELIYAPRMSFHLSCKKFEFRSFFVPILRTSLFLLFFPELFSTGVTSDQWKRYLNSPHRPLNLDGQHDALINRDFGLCGYLKMVMSPFLPDSIPIFFPCIGSESILLVDERKRFRHA